MYKLSRDENDNRIITISRVSDSKVIHKYKENKYKETITKFIKIHNIDWFVGGNHYEHQFFLNLQTGKIYNQKEADLFIWTDVIVSKDSRIILVTGCIWGCPYTWKLYDISNIEQHGWPELNVKRVDNFQYTTTATSKNNDYNDYIEDDGIWDHWNIFVIEKDKLYIYEDTNKTKLIGIFHIYSKSETYNNYFLDNDI